MQINAADEPSEVTILEEESEVAATEDNEVIVLEESAVVSPAPVLITSAPEAGSECSPWRQAHTPSRFFFHIYLYYDYLNCFVTLLQFTSEFIAMTALKHAQKHET